MSATRHLAAYLTGETASGLLDGKIRIKNSASDLLDGKAVIEFGATAANLLDGKTTIRDAAGNFLDGKARIGSVVVNLLDGSLFIHGLATNLLDGKAIVAFPATGLLDGLAIIKYIYPAIAAWLDIPPASQWALPAAEPRREIFVAVLRKTGFDDVEVPMSSMQLRRRTGTPTMVSCVVPDAMTYLAAAEARKNGELIIYAGSATLDGTRHLSELERATLEDVHYDVGVKSSSLSLGGYRTVTTSNPRPVDLEAVSYSGLQADGKRRVRAKVNIFLRPGDTAIYGEESFVVEQIYIKVEARNSWMEAAGI